MRSADVFFILLILMHSNVAYKIFLDVIPNGKNVFNPCAVDVVWIGVGHKNPEGGGDRNPFGTAFEANRKVWSRELCQLDSDGDGISNGQELGDPRCAWKIGQLPERVINISHPGICEPLDSPACFDKNRWLNCSAIKEHVCPAREHPGMMKKTLKFPESHVPSAVTSYHCMIFDLPKDDDFHLVATRPEVDNSHVVHHMLLFGCDERLAEVNTSEKPYPCGMQAHPKCEQLIGTWTLGSNGDCLHPDTGFRIGIHGYKRAALQVHWNNPTKSSTMTDGSGMTLFYTKQRRRYDAAMFTVGQEYIVIPPRMQSVSVTSVCPGDCTKDMFGGNLYLIGAINHMHYLGHSQMITLYRDGKFHREITNDSEYHYDKPRFYQFDSPIELLPGDELRTVCTYSSANINRTVKFGIGTDEEMCFGFLTYYPAREMKIPFCTSWKSVHKCRRYLPKYNGIIDGCRWQHFLNFSDPTAIKLRSDCSLEMIDDHKKFCREDCSATLNKTRTHECLKGDIGEFIKFKLKTSEKGKTILQALNSCLHTPNGAKKYEQTVFVLLTFVSILLFAWNDEI
ncbi:hypothetical protein CHS0354_024842 [Potamilus streckersoni]|uniref:Temptin n=1 Tax=Potamilus streckersoni TaxID=2493646 RepID=A0AAE0VH75_9BIVA|nr:hypothetical protein CHS0354_024842 [Potamilus streckersoni]